MHQKETNGLSLKITLTTSKLKSSRLDTCYYLYVP